MENKFQNLHPRKLRLETWKKHPVYSENHLNQKSSFPGFKKCNFPSGEKNISSNFEAEFIWPPSFVWENKSDKKN